MKTFTSLFALFLALGVTQAAEYDLCHVTGVGYGTCMRTSMCTSGGGGTYTGFCPNDPANIKCCVKKCPGPMNAGRCRPINACPSHNFLKGTMNQKITSVISKLRTTRRILPWTR